MSGRKRKPAAPAPRANAMIFADASVCTQSHAAGWGAWVKRDGGVSQVFGGPFAASMKTPDDAEISALANALYRAVHWQLIEPGDVVMLQSDSLNSLTRIRGHIGAANNGARGGLAVGLPAKRARPLSTQAAAAVEVIRKLVADARLSLVVRHVKGHTGEGKGRSWVNAACDRTAKQHMKARRREILAAQSAAPAEMESAAP
jgi:ribonuclease HI